MARGRSGGGRSGGSRSGSRSSSSRSSSSGRSYSSSRSSSSGRSYSSSRSSSSGRSYSSSRSSSSGRSYSSSRSSSSGRNHSSSLGRSTIGNPGSPIFGSSWGRGSAYGSSRPIRPGVPTGSYHTRPIGGSIFNGGNIFNGGSTYGGGVFSGNDTGRYNGQPYSGTRSGEQQTYQSSAQSSVPEGQMTIPGAEPYASSGESRTNQDASPTYNGDTSSKSKSGCLTTFLTVAIWCVILMLLFGFISGAFSDSGDGFTKSTIEREKMQLGLSDAAGYYTDECGWIGNRTKMESGLKAFYDLTGILPYVYIIDNIAGDYDPSTEALEQFAADTYEALFEDEGHALLVFWDYADAYEYTLWLGEDAAELMDYEACDILFDYLDYYYYEDVSDEEFFANAFQEAGERMMEITPTSASKLVKVVCVIAAMAAIAVLLKRNQKKKAEEEARRKRAEEILNAPLEKFGKDGSFIDELEKKYEKEI